jgi:hypothetical protein
MKLQPLLKGKKMPSPHSTCLQGQQHGRCQPLMSLAMLPLLLRWLLNVLLRDLTYAIK